jgi:hypothetical protein
MESLRNDKVLINLEFIPDDMIGVIVQHVDITDLSRLCRINKKFWKICHKIGLEEINTLKRNIIEQKLYELLKLLLEFTCRGCRIIIKDDLMNIHLKIILNYRFEKHRYLYITRKTKPPLDDYKNIELDMIFDEKTMEILDQTQFDSLLENFTQVYDLPKSCFITVENIPLYDEKVSIEGLKKEIDNRNHTTDQMFTLENTEYTDITQLKTLNLVKVLNLYSLKDFVKISSELKFKQL